MLNSTINFFHPYLSQTFLFVFHPLSLFLILYLEEEWERELEAELQDYEVVGDNSNSKNENWEKEIDEILEEEDLK